MYIILHSIQISPVIAIQEEKLKQEQKKTLLRCWEPSDTFLDKHKKVDLLNQD